MIKLIVQDNEKILSEFEQKEGDKEISIGRAPGCSIRLDDNAVSRLHAIIHYTNDNWVIEKKTNSGTVSINGETIENAILSGSENIKIGKFLLYVQKAEIPGVASFDGISDYDGVDVENEKTSFVAIASTVGFFRFEPDSANVSEFVMKNNLAVFGRGSNCDVVLTEKRASRKHVEIRRQGLSFFLKDLNSANGTLLNGQLVKDEIELVPGDNIEIGECKFQFSIENKDFFSKQNEFLPVPSYLAEENSTDINSSQLPMDSGAQTQAFGEQQGADAFQFSVNAQEPEEKSLFKKLLKKYRALPPRQRYLVILISFAFIVALLGGEEDQKSKSPKNTVKMGQDGKPLRIFSNLSADKKKFVKKAYDDLLAAQEKKDYGKVIESASKIFTYLDDYNQTKSLELLAKKAIEEQEQKEREKKQQERQEKIRKEVLALEDKGKETYIKALKDSKFREELFKIVQEIYSKAPNNRLAEEWTTGIKEKEAEEKREKEIARQKEALKQKAELALSNVEKIFSETRYVLALSEAEKLKEIGYSEKEYLDKVEELKERVLAKLAAIIDPLLQDAEAQNKEGGDLVKSKDLYMQVLKVDPANQKAIAGLNDIRDRLHARAKRLYAEAILAESISDLMEAKDKYSKCLRTAPEDDVYKKKCKNKMLKYESFNEEQI